MFESGLSIGQWAGVAVGTLLALAFTMQKLWKSSVETGAGTAIVQLLHTELQRMAEQNTQLATELNRLQSEIIKLNGQLVRLTDENTRLHSEVQLLTREVGRLQHVLDKGRSV